MAASLVRSLILSLSMTLLLAGFLAPVSSRAAEEAWNRDAIYDARIAQLKQRVQARPRDPSALAELAAFLLRPVAMRRTEAVDGRLRACPAPLRDEVIVGVSKTEYAVPWVFRGDAAAAYPLLVAALRLDPDNHAAHRLLAIVYRMREDVVSMQPHVRRVLAQDPLDLDMARLYLDFHTVQARILNDRAGALRTSRVYFEERTDGRYRVTTYPSQADVAQAGRLDAQAQNHRREAIKPLRALVTRIKGKPELKSLHDLANANYYHWLGDLGTAAGAAKAALQADPTNLEALDFLIDVARGTHTTDLYKQYLAIRDRWAGADTRIRYTPIGPPRPRG